MMPSNQRPAIAKDLSLDLPTSTSAFVIPSFIIHLVHPPKSIKTFRHPPYIVYQPYSFVRHPFSVHHSVVHHPPCPTPIQTVHMSSIAHIHQSDIHLSNVHVHRDGNSRFITALAIIFCTPLRNNNDVSNDTTTTTPTPTTTTIPTMTRTTTTTPTLTTTDGDDHGGDD
ncbi:hypothetical protein BC936DRAFT_143754 [Jimgerdemannia flammicorona]|uniref:Uncharacterized protein n=1 Tax=Jimgerdemannia flammicorona TaxID=994334 RepID=A0A432ZYM8_9FUNG|nr:hypothetical protein BC936DRAFT_143754 [Jimgerdemannia flammicorona]